MKSSDHENDELEHKYGAEITENEVCASKFHFGGFKRLTFMGSTYDI